MPKSPDTDDSKTISGIRIGKTQTRTAIVAYADDVTIFGWKTHLSC